jgi:hypothetical protein
MARNNKYWDEDDLDDWEDENDYEPAPPPPKKVLAAQTVLKLC